MVMYSGILHGTAITISKTPGKYCIVAAFCSSSDERQKHGSPARVGFHGWVEPAVGVGSESAPSRHSTSFTCCVVRQNHGLHYHP